MASPSSPNDPPGRQPDDGTDAPDDAPPENGDGSGSSSGEGPVSPESPDEGRPEAGNPDNEIPPPPQPVPRNSGEEQSLKGDAGSEPEPEGDDEALDAPSGDGSADVGAGSIGETTDAGQGDEHAGDSHHHDDEWQDEHYYDGHEDDPYHYEYDEEMHREEDDYHPHPHGGSPDEVKPPASSALVNKSADTDRAPSTADDDWDDEEDDEAGGPIKSFLEHLEDLRWVIIKCCSALAVAMVVCLVAADKVVEVLTYPLKTAHSKAVVRAYNAMEAAGALPKAAIEIQLDATNTVLVELEGSATNLYPTLRGGHVMPVRLAVELLDGRPSLTFKQSGSITRYAPRVKVPELQPLSVLDPFFAALKIAFFGGIVLASPFIIWFIGGFVVPALKRTERVHLGRGMLLGGGLFMVGVLFAYLVIANMAVGASVKFAEWMGFATNIWRMDAYIGFICKMMLGVGIGFELPVVLLTLVKIGIVDYTGLKKFRPYWVVVNLFLCAFLTPPDVVSQVMMWVPMQLLFELSVFVSWIWYRQEQREQAAAA